ncbi:MAG: DUF433 domain-containing protein [bacterium]
MPKELIVSESIETKKAAEKTPVTLSFILEKLAGGETIEQILKIHPRLSRGRIQEALFFASEAVRTEVSYSIVAGTDITVESILEEMAYGKTIDQIIEFHPRLTHEAVREALYFAAEDLRTDVIYPVAEEIV